ncbi:MAG: hypothetical protein A3H47_06120 [Deltaproteobacteria bacterium RIFCSPLOWO2_02_FULL_42_39]|nr:MAG: hypothetical protein A3D29_04290 [Deltaproteobacteria bacterium RIFCSPHIGHO2_02_FULL_42_44]OGQ37819.1 MAG: hypothetical protein A3H47_06120 [Deltaproteobacteria bacterium RIFCSPLOWO2_02_FULL_42_39]
MSSIAKESSFFSRICTDLCKGMCCDPWWGIISYTIVKEGVISNPDDFKKEIAKGIHDRVQRITEVYVTNERPARRLFNLPERYTVHVRNINTNGNKLSINVLAMFAFRCIFLSPDKTCLIHPSFLGGADIRPPQCGFMGSLNAHIGEKGYCRIIHAAQTNNESAIERAIEVEKNASERHYKEGFQTAEEAAEAVIGRVREYCFKYAKHLLAGERQAVLGRNDPCYCGSNKKYKKCHGQ